MGGLREDGGGGACGLVFPEHYANYHLHLRLRLWEDKLPPSFTPQALGRQATTFIYASCSGKTSCHLHLRLMLWEDRSHRGPVGLGFRVWALYTEGARHVTNFMRAPYSERAGRSVDMLAAGEGGGRGGDAKGEGFEQHV